MRDWKGIFLRVWRGKCPSLSIVLNSIWWTLKIGSRSSRKTTQPRERRTSKIWIHMEAQYKTSSSTLKTMKNTLKVMPYLTNIVKEYLSEIQEYTSTLTGLELEGKVRNCMTLDVQLKKNTVQPEDGISLWEISLLRMSMAEIRRGSTPRMER